MYLLHDFLNKLYYFLIESEDVDNNIVRKHTRALQILGDLSFPLETRNWHNYLNQEKTFTEINNVFEIRNSKVDLQVHLQHLIKESKCWPLHIEKCEILRNNNIHLWLDRPVAFSTVIKDVLKQQRSYGSVDLHFNNILRIKSDVPSDDLVNITLTNLKVILIETFLNNLLQFNKCHYKNDTSENVKSILLTSKSCNDSCDKVLIICGAVLNEKRTKNGLSASELYNKQAINMRLMAEHKYGIRVTTNPQWKELFKKLGEAAVTIDMLQNKPQHTTVIDVNSPAPSKSKGAAFILYNCARLATLFKEFDKKVSENIYPPLPCLDNIDYSLLVQPEEWELLYVYILQFPLIIKMCLKDLEHGKVHPHYLVSMLSKISYLFSIYYRRVRILIEPRSHLFPLIHARICLLKCVECVFHNGLHLLNIQPVKQM